MNETKFKFDKNIPAEILPSIKKNLLALEYLIPAWCHEVTVNYIADVDYQAVMDGAKADCLIRYQYRKGVMNFYPEYVVDDEAGRMNSCIHEVLHLTLNILYDYGRGEMKNLTRDNNDLRKHILDEFEARLESVVCDLTHILQTRLGVGQNVNGLTEEWVKKLRA